MRVVACEQRIKRDRRERKEKKSDSFSPSSKPETGKRERSPKKGREDDLERGPVSDTSSEIPKVKEHESGSEDSGKESEKDQWLDATLRVMAGLRGDAFQRANKDLGVQTLSAPGGLRKLIQEIKRMVFPLGTLEAQALFRSGQAQYGPLSRQAGESVVSYISRRRRWWELMQQLDPRISLSDGLRAEPMLELSGLTKDQQLMIKACAGGDNSFEGFAKILIEHHGNIHLRDNRILAPFGKGKVLNIQFPLWPPGVLHVFPCIITCIAVEATDDFAGAFVEWKRFLMVAELHRS